MDVRKATGTISRHGMAMSVLVGIEITSFLCVCVRSVYVVFCPNVHTRIVIL